MNHEQIMTAVKDWLASVKPANVTVVEANQNAPRPALPFITVYQTGTALAEHSEISAPDADGDAVIRNDAEIMISLQCFGENSKAIMDGVRISLERETIRRALRAAGLPYIRTLNGVTDNTETVGTRYEERAGMDLEFRAALTVSDSIGVIETATGAAVISTSSTNTINDTFTIGETQ